MRQPAPHRILTPKTASAVYNGTRARLREMNTMQRRAYLIDIQLQIDRTPQWAHFSRWYWSAVYMRDIVNFELNKGK